MLKHLTIQNLILVDKAELSFHEGLNILTGETGSGKSAVMYGLGLAIGERADTSMIRQGCEKAMVEAVFEIPTHSLLIPLLTEGGIDHEEQQDLIIRREISLSGKGRVMINHQTIQLSFLRKVGSHLVQIVGQHANQLLFSTDYHREVVDLYGLLHPLVRTFQDSYDREQKLRRELQQLIQDEGQRIRQIDAYRQELEEIHAAQIRQGEEEELFGEYTLLSNAEEVLSKISEINRILAGDRGPVLNTLNRQKQNLESLVPFDPFLEEPLNAFQNAYLELQEVAYSLEQYQNKLHFDPERLNVINERLSLLNQLKRKYGSTIEGIINYQKEAAAKLTSLENVDLAIEKIESELHEVSEKTDQLAKQLTLKRVKYASEMEKAVTHHLHSLNMSKAIFSIEVIREQRTRDGEDLIEFFLCPNLGERKIALKEGASGGEMSRVLLALQTLLAGKEQKKVLIFDEVDANIGGETATIVGDKLQQISQQHQVICITHFPQVARQANHHFQISKEEKEGRTTSLVKELDRDSRQFELARMAGTAIKN